MEWRFVGARLGPVPLLSSHSPGEPVSRGQLGGTVSCLKSSQFTGPFKKQDRLPQRTLPFCQPEGSSRQLRNSRRGIQQGLQLGGEFLPSSVLALLLSGTGIPGDWASSSMQVVAGWCSSAGPAASLAPGCPALNSVLCAAPGRGSASVAWVAAYLDPSQTSGQALMRSRSSEVGVGLALREGHTGLTIKDECKPIPVEKTQKKTSPCTC
ncbi:hypothetical protein NQZ68_003892 [Dissostichus eleginoides]|nr:hypothetical protein NQZ68_003892 [Dissostichus eleginoides]